MGNADVLRRAYEAYRTGDVAAAVATLDPDVVWEEPDHGGFMGLDAVYRGIDGVGRWMREVLQAFDELDAEMPEVHEGPETVVVATLITARGRESGAKVQSTYWNVFWIRDDRIVHRKVFVEREAALAAAGIDPAAAPAGAVAPQV